MPDFHRLNHLDRIENTAVPTGVSGWEQANRKMLGPGGVGYLYPMEIRNLSTPAAVVDLDRLVNNLSNTARRATDLGVDLRPHFKTHKCVKIAALQADLGCCGFAVSTLAEARVLADAGHTDITYAVPLSPDKIGACSELIKQGVDLHVLVDHPQTVSRIREFATTYGCRFSLFIKVDCGYHRAGIDPSSAAAVELASDIDESQRLTLKGILTHAGHSYACSSRKEALGVARQERDIMVRFAAKLRERGLPFETVSVGSTPTFTAIDHLEGVTETRPGNSVFFDVFQATIGSASTVDIAFAVLTSVVGVYPDRGAAVIDAGGLALSQDPGPVQADPDCGFGIVSDLSWQPHPGLHLTSLSQEHGLIRGSKEAIAGLAPGKKLLALPNHSCLAAACFDTVSVVRGHRVVERWSTARGW